MTPIEGIENIMGTDAPERPVDDPVTEPMPEPELPPVPQPVPGEEVEPKPEPVKPPSDPHTPPLDRKEDRIYLREDDPRRVEIERELAESRRD